MPAIVVVAADAAVVVVAVADEMIEINLSLLPAPFVPSQEHDCFSCVQTSHLEQYSPLPTPFVPSLSHTHTTPHLTLPPPLGC